ncbi:MAG: V-type ATPase subunit [Clostridia bacterium]|nr:V-type ATPase subunit [Clostridia bacterium]
MSKAANAILALSRSFYGKRLTEKDYLALLSCKSINELVSYLKSRTVYSAVFESLGSQYEASAVEDAVQRFKFERFGSLCRYELAIGNKFYKYFIVKTEIEQILRCTLLLLGGNKGEYMMGFGEFLNSHLTIDLYAMGKAETLEALAQSLEKTPYEKVFNKCLRGKNRSYLAFESAFDDYFEGFHKELIDKCFSGDEKKQVHDLACRIFDAAYIKKLFRIIKYYKETKSVINVSHQKMTLFSQKQQRELFNCENEEQLFKVLTESVYKNYFSNKNDLSIERLTEKGLYDFCKKNLRFSTHPGVVMYCYLFIAQNEAMNIIKITEGIKYGVSPENIRSTLIGAFE